METGQLSMDVINAARRVVDSAHQRPASNLDFSPESLPIVGGMLAEAATFAAGLSASTKDSVNHSAATSSRWGDGNSEDAISGTINTTRRPGCRRTVVSRCPGVLGTRCAQAQRRPRGQHPVLLRWLCQTGKGGAPGGSGHFHLDGGQEYSHFIGPWENFQVGLCHPSDPWGDGHISSSIALAMKVWFGHTAHSQSQHSYHPSIGAEN